MKSSHARTILAGMAGGFARNIMMLLTFRFIGFGMNGDDILLNSAYQRKSLSQSGPNCSSCPWWQLWKGADQVWGDYEKHRDYFNLEKEPTETELKGKVMRKIKLILILVLSAGWLFPAYAAVGTFLSYLDDEVSDLLRHGQSMYDFPFILEVQRWAAVAFIWFGAALLFWSFIGARHILKNTEKKD